MARKRPVAAYPFAQTALWKRCWSLFPSLDRDAARLKAYGVTAERIAKFKTDTRLFGEMEPDDEMVQEGALVTEEKNAEQEALVTSIQKVMGCVGLRDEPRTGNYKRFGATNVANNSEAELHLAAGIVVPQGRKYLGDYAGVGLTKKMLDAVEADDRKFMAGLVERKNSENGRHATTDARIGKANALYEELVKICAAGHTSWRFDDKTKADEYVVDATAGGGSAPTPPPVG